MYVQIFEEKIKNSEIYIQSMYFNSKYVIYQRNVVESILFSIDSRIVQLS